MKLVPNKSGGVSRRSYQRTYAKSANAKVSDTLGKFKLRSETIKPAKIDTSRNKTPGGVSNRRDYSSSSDFSADFGTTGFTAEENRFETKR